MDSWPSTDSILHTLYKLRGTRTSINSAPGTQEPQELQDPGLYAVQSMCISLLNPSRCSHLRLSYAADHAFDHLSFILQPTRNATLCRQKSQTNTSMFGLTAAESRPPQCSSLVSACVGLHFFFRVFFQDDPSHHTLVKKIEYVLPLGQAKVVTLHDSQRLLEQRHLLKVIMMFRLHDMQFRSSWFVQNRVAHVDNRFQDLGIDRICVGGSCLEDLHRIWEHLIRQSGPERHLQNFG